MSLEERVAALEQALEKVMEVVAQLAAARNRPGLEEAHRLFQERLRERRTGETE